MRQTANFYAGIITAIMALLIPAAAYAASPVGSVKEVTMEGFNYAEKGFDIGVVCSVDGMAGRPLVCVVQGLDAQGKGILQPNGEPIEVFDVLEVNENAVKDAMIPLVMPQKSLKGVKDLYLKCLLFAADTEELIAESALFHVDQDAIKAKMASQAEDIAGGLIDLFFGGGNSGLEYDDKGYDSEGYDKNGYRICYSCGGSGRCDVCGGYGKGYDDEPCNSCGGSGECHNCNGKGKT